MSQSEAMRCPERSRIVRERYADALPEEITEWARRWKVSRESIRRRAAELGVKRAAWAAQQAHREAALALASAAIGLEFGKSDRDEEYAALCREQGGFPVRVVLNGKTYDVRVR